MNSLDKALCLYAITDHTWLQGRSIEEVTEEALIGGATMIQIREKNISFDEYVKRALSLKKLCHRYGVPLIVNDNVEVAIASEADGVHVGQSDLDCISARKKIPSSFILGVSAQTVEQAQEAERNGADYLGVGALFPTDTKEDAHTISLDLFDEICSSVSLPIVGIGGIDCAKIKRLKGHKMKGVSVISAIFASPNITKATAELYQEVSSCIQP